MLPGDLKKMRGKGVLGWIIAFLLVGDVFTLLIHTEDTGPHIFETIATTSSTTSTTLPSTTTTTITPGVPITTTTVADGSTTTTGVPGATTTTTTGKPLADNPFVGNTFLVQSATQNGADYPITSRITVTFSQDGNVQTAYWDDGCNSASAPVVIKAGAIDVGEVATTKMGCPANQPADTYFLTPLMKADPRWSKQGASFVFEGGGRTVTATAL